MRSTPHSDSEPAAAEAAPAATAPEAAAQPLGDAIAQGKQWLKSLDVDQLLGQLPQPVRDLGTQVGDRVRRLTPTQQAVGGAVLALGLGWLAVRGRRNARTADAKASGKYRAKFDSKPFKGRGKPQYASS